MSYKKMSFVVIIITILIILVEQVSKIKKSIALVLVAAIEKITTDLIMVKMILDVATVLTQIEAISVIGDINKYEYIFVLMK